MGASKQYKDSFDGIGDMSDIIERQRQLMKNYEPPDIDDDIDREIKAMKFDGITSREKRAAPLKLVSSVAAVFVVAVLALTAFMMRGGDLDFVQIEGKEFGGQNFGPVYILREEISREEFVSATGAVLPKDGWSGWHGDVSVTATKYFDDRHEIAYSMLTAESEAAKLVVSTQAIFLTGGMSPSPNANIRGQQLSLARDGDDYYAYWRRDGLDYLLMFKNGELKAVEKALREYF